MFEGLVQKLLLGYLGRYVKDFQKDQLKITLWNEEVLLENVELNLEAFDYLQLPFGLKQARVGRLSIKIPWKKLGWDPIIIILEDVFMCASQRDEKEWSFEAVEQREFASKKAKLAAAELAKLSRRVCDNQAGQSFTSYITAKILDSIQVSIRNVHATYRDMQTDSAHALFGIRFSSLTIMKQSMAGSSSGRIRGPNVNKVVEILGLEIYCSTLKDNQAMKNVEGAAKTNTEFEVNSFDSILAPFDFSLSLLVNRSGKIDIDAPQYSISSEIIGLTISMDEVQLRQLLLLYDYLSTCQLREKYGRYRPWSIPVSKQGWQTAWWHYAQESVLSDLRKKRKKTSWKHIGQKLSLRRKYISLYKAKLDNLRQDQPIDENLLRELEQMERKADIDEILDYRSAAENKLKMNSSSSSPDISNSNSAGGKLENDERSMLRPRGWLNWLSRGMLGAGGTDDSSQFSGVVSDDVIKDIYEATKFHPVPGQKGDSAVYDQIYFSAINFSIHKVSAKLRCMKLDLEIAEVILHEVTIEGKIWKEYATFTAFVNSGEIAYTHNEKSILLMNKPLFEKNILVNTTPSFSVYVDISPVHSEAEFSVKVMLNQVEVTCDSEFFLNFMEFYNVLKFFKFQHERVLASLNGIGSVKDRFLSKSEHILFRRKKVIWDVSFINTIIYIPWRIANSKTCYLVLEFGSCYILSKSSPGALASDIDDQACILRNCSNSCSNNDLFEDIQFQNLYDHFEVNLNDVEMRIEWPYLPQTVTVCDKFFCSITFSTCIIPDEPILKQLVVHINTASIHTYFSPSKYGVLLGLIAHINMLKSDFESLLIRVSDPRGQTASEPFKFSLFAKLSVFTILVNLENDVENSSILAITLDDLDIRYALMEREECRICMKALKVITYMITDERDIQTLCSSANVCTSNFTNQHDMVSGLDPNGCLGLHYEAVGNGNSAGHKCTVYMNNADFHCYPNKFGLLVEFFNKLSSFNEISSEFGSHENATIPFERFSFITSQNYVALGSLDSSQIYSISEWAKYINFGEREISSPKSKSVLESVVRSGGFGTDLFVIDLNLSGVRLHFHDSFSIICTVTLPMSKTLISIDINCVDISCSIEGLIISSSWWTQKFHEPLWGPSLLNLSPVLKIRVRSGKFESLSSQTDICFGIQHVCCILPPEFLSIIIGYFSLPDWGKSNNIEVKNSDAFIYNFEVLDSVLISPVENEDNQFLILEIPQLYCSFIEKNSSYSALKYIPAKCAVPTQKVSVENNSLNVFARDFILSLHTKNNIHDSLLHSQDVGRKNFHLIALFSADVWVIMPFESELSPARYPAFTCIMTEMISCQLIAADDLSFGGFEALMDVVSQLSSIEEESKGFTDDVLQFLQFKRGLKEKIDCVTNVSSTFVELRCCVNSLQIRLHQPKSDLHSSESVANADIQFMCSASFRNDTLSNLDISFSFLALNSVHNSIKLAQCLPICANSPVFVFQYYVSDQGVVELRSSLPSLEIWLHLFEWNEIIDILSSYAGKLSKTSIADASPKNFALQSVHDQRENVRATASHGELLSLSESTGFSLKNSKHDKFALIGASEDIGVTIHVPISSSKEENTKTKVTNYTDHMSQSDASSIDEGNYSKFVIVSLHSRRSELSFSDGEVSIRSNFDKIIGEIGIWEEKMVQSWPIFQISQVSVDAELCNNATELLLLKINVQCDRFDVCLSHHVFYFWHDIWFKAPEENSHPVMLGNLNMEVTVKKVSLVLTDGRWSCNGPLLELRMKNLLLNVDVTGNNLDTSVTSDLQVNYNNIHKVLWEPFVEPTKFQLNINRRQEMNALLNSSMMTDFILHSTERLNLNLTESLIESIFRAAEMIKDALGLIEPNDIPQGQKFSKHRSNENISAGRYAPYIVQNLTSLPLLFHVFQKGASTDELDISSMKEQSLKPGSSVPIYINETPEEQLFRYSPASSSGRLTDKQSSMVSHHYIRIKFDRTSKSSAPMSMDIFGLSYFEVNLSKPANKLEGKQKGEDPFFGNGKTEASSGFIVPVVFDVSVQRYSKLIRLYSTVILLNGTSTPLELRFDIPFGVSPKILDPIYPGQEFPLPLHLAEAGRLRWRPVGSTYLWSEAHILSTILSHESRIGFLRSFVCYPSHPSSDPFRCCISVQDIGLPSSDRSKKGSSRYIHQVTLSTPLLVKNYLTETISLTIESGGVTRAALLSEVETSFFHIDSSCDLGLGFEIYGYKSSGCKFQRMETFSAMAKVNGTQFSLLEILTFNSDLGCGPLCVMVEKVMDAISGARELCIFVPFLLYNCTGDSLVISDSGADTGGNICTVPSCPDLVQQELLQGRKDGLAFLSSDQDSNVVFRQFDNAKNHSASARNTDHCYSKNFLSRSLVLSESSSISNEQTNKHVLEGKKGSTNTLKSRSSSSIQFNRMGSDAVLNEYGKVKPCMYSPKPNPSADDIMVRVSRSPVECVNTNIPNNISWSSPFFLVPPSGSTCVFVPRQTKNAASIISVTSSAVAEPFVGRTKIITFQPRYVISNACSKDLCYKQKGANVLFHLSVGQHSHLHWTDTTREMLVSIRFNETGWQWSGSFLPDHIGDTQVKMWNHVSGMSNMVRVEVQNADVSIQDEKIVGNLHRKSGTNLILISDDDTGFMPYRIDNFSKERLRVYQQKCENCETIVHSYTSCPYAWDEPFYLHRLTVEVPGERVLGSYTLDEIKEYMPVNLPSSSEKPERLFLVSVHAEGAMKVLSIIDSNYHTLKDTKNPSFHQNKGKEKHDHQRDEKCVHYSEKISIIIPNIGISLINNQPQELVFACAKNITIDLVQSLDKQKLSFQIASLQVDNQLRSAPYPVLLSFLQEHKSKSENVMQIAFSTSCEPVLSLAAAKWRNEDISLLSYEYISLRIQDFCLELEQEVILSLFDLYGTFFSRFESGKISYNNLDFLQDSSTSTSMFTESHKSCPSIPSVVPIGAPWQRIYLLAKRKKKVYVEEFYLSPIKLTLSFSSTPWKLRNGTLTSGESLIHRGIMALADVEGAQIHFKELTISHHMGSFESIEEILQRHYTRQLYQEMYKVFGSAGVIGNPMGFMRSLGLGFKDFVSAPARNLFHSPTGLITGVAQGTKSLLSSTVYAFSDATSQISRAAHKGIVAFTFDDQAVAKMEMQQKGVALHSKGVINEVLEGLTGLLQSPIKGAEKHGLPGVVSGIALGVTGLVAKPAASILEVTGKTAQSIRNRSKLHQKGSLRFRARLPRPLSKKLPLRPYSWEEAVGISVLIDIDDGLKLKDENLVMCKSLKDGGKFVVITERLILVVSCSSLAALGQTDFLGVPADPEWVIEKEIGLESVIHADMDADGAVVHIVGSNSEIIVNRSSGARAKRWYNHSTSLPLFQTNFELTCREEATNFLQVLLSTIEIGKERGWGCGYLLHQINLNPKTTR